MLEISVEIINSLCFHSVHDIVYTLHTLTHIFSISNQHLSTKRCANVILAYPLFDGNATCIVLSIVLLN